MLTPYSGIRASNTQIDIFYIVSTAPTDNDLEVRYFTHMASGFLEDASHPSSWTIQKTAEKLKANTEYVIYFKSKETKPSPEKLTFELKFSPTNAEKVGTFFKDSFDKITRNY